MSSHWLFSVKTLLVFFNMFEWNGKMRKMSVDGGLDASNTTKLRSQQPHQDLQTLIWLLCLWQRCRRCEAASHRKPGTFNPIQQPPRYPYYWDTSENKITESLTHSKFALGGMGVANVFHLLLNRNNGGGGGEQQAECWLNAGLLSCVTWGECLQVLSSVWSHKAV